MDLCACLLLFVTESPLQSQRICERCEEEEVEVEAHGAVHEPSLRNALGCHGDSNPALVLEPKELLTAGF